MKLSTRLFHEARFMVAEVFCPNGCKNDWKKEKEGYVCTTCKCNYIVCADCDPNLKRADGTISIIEIED
ncbi:MAG: hypothetical protein WC511_03250 [Candidatus Pacearchaeota archaeon]